MSTLTGHSSITRQAVKEISSACENHLIASNLGMAALHQNVVTRDILDVLNLGHWADYGQSHHFMRRFDGQSPLEAYREDTEWVRSNALGAATTLTWRMRRYLGKSANSGIAAHACERKTCNLPAMSSGNQRGLARSILDVHESDTGYDSAYRDPAHWQDFGNALHAVQDSFSDGHVVRDGEGSETQPGPIKYIKKYLSADVEEHEHADEGWWNEKESRFTLKGRQAINASKALIEVVVRTAQAGYATNSVSHLHGWKAYQAKWLAASPELSKLRDFEVDFIERFHTGPVLGDSNIKTLNMDEEGMADALIKEFGVDTRKVHKVFLRLDDKYNSDVDDIALLYVNHLRQKKAPGIAGALARDTALIDLLIKVMDEGWTDDEEQACIDYLKSLKKG